VSHLTEENCSWRTEAQHSIVTQSGSQDIGLEFRLTCLYKYATAAIRNLCTPALMCTQVTPGVETASLIAAEMLLAALL